MPDRQVFLRIINDFWTDLFGSITLQVYYSRKIVRPPAKQKSHQYSFAWRKPFLQNLRPHLRFAQTVTLLVFAPLSKSPMKVKSEVSVMRFVIGNLMAGQMLVPEDIVGTFRKELEHRMMLQDLKIDAWLKKETR